MNGTHQVLAYADDVNLIGDDIRTIGRNADGLLNTFNDIGLAVNTGKTTYMEMGRHRGMMADEHSTVVIHLKMQRNSLYRHYYLILL